MIQTHKKTQERLGEIESNKRSTWGRPKYPPPVPKNSRQRPYISVSLSVPLLSPSLPLASHSLSTSSIPVSIPFCPSPSIKQDQQSTISNNQQSNDVLMLQPECMSLCKCRDCYLLTPPSLSRQRVCPPTPPLPQRRASWKEAGRIL